MNNGDAEDKNGRKTFSNEVTKCENCGVERNGSNVYIKVAD